MMAPDLARKFWSRVDRPSPYACWEWTAGQNRGYGYFYIGGPSRTYVRAHRYAYELAVRAIPEGLVIDHLCRNTTCVNPAHLEAVMQRENVLRGESFIAQQAQQTHCKWGHEFTPENTRWVEPNRRLCITCRRQRQREYKQRRKAREAS